MRKLNEFRKFIIANTPENQQGLDCNNSGMIPVESKPIYTSIGFFPYGEGLFHCTDLKCPGVKVSPCREEKDRGRMGEFEFPVGKYMILGQDFGNQAYIDKIRKTAEKRKVSLKCELARGSPTWRNLVTLLNNCEIPLKDCFLPTR